MGFFELGLVPEVLQALTECGYQEPTPIQSQVIPVALTGCDVMAGAQTGTGKTAGFTLPMLSRLADFATTSPSPARHPVRGLVLTPTRELAVQVEESVRRYGKYLPFRVSVVYGGSNMQPQIDALRAGVDILVATPGRLLDHVQNKTLDLSRVQIFVLDEADRMLDMGFMPDLRRIIELLPEARQNLMFSATFSAEIKKLADGIMRSPQLVEVAQRNTAAETVRQSVVLVERERKHAALVKLIRVRELKQVLVFCGTKLGANRLVQHLIRQGIAANAIHGDKAQQARMEALEQFKRGEMTVLVATDVAARGIDIDQLPTVINYDLPRAAEDYVHRIGRTGRAGAQGEAISLVAPEEQVLLSGIEKLLGRRIPVEALEGKVVGEEMLDEQTIDARTLGEGVAVDPTDVMPEVSGERSGSCVAWQDFGRSGAENVKKTQIAALFLPPVAGDGKR